MAFRAVAAPCTCQPGERRAGRALRSQAGGRPDVRSRRNLTRMLPMAPGEVPLRRLEAILCGDIVGYSKHMSYDEEGTLARVCSRDRPQARNRSRLAGSRLAGPRRAVAFL
jgi:hypothetical protein